jgi:hypothetical protein
MIIVERDYIDDEEHVRVDEQRETCGEGRGQEYD